jgi:hypothetical protein
MLLNTNTGVRLKVAEFLAHNTVKIVALVDDGNYSIGTGFLYKFVGRDETPYPALVTNRHVLDGVKEIRLLFNPRGVDNKADFNANKIEFLITEAEPAWIKHPNPNIDLALIPMSAIFYKMEQDGTLAFMTFLEKHNLPKPEEWNDLMALEDVIIVGYPDGIWDSLNNLPIFKKGIAATHPKIDYEGRPQFLIDAAIYPGSSGSPVFLYKYSDVMVGADLDLGKDKPRLAGILSSGFMHSETGELKSIPIPTVKKNKVFEVSFPNNLGVVIKHTELEGFIPTINEKIKQYQNAQLHKNDKAQKYSEQA